MTKRTEVIVTLTHVPDYMVTRRSLLLDAPTVTSRKSLRDSAGTDNKVAKRGRLSDEGTDFSISDLTSAPKVTQRRSLAASAASSKQSELQHAFDDKVYFPRAPKVTERKSLAGIRHPGSTTYTAILIVNEDGTTPTGFDVAEADELYGVTPLYFSSMKELQTRLDSDRKAKSSFMVTGGIMVQERDTAEAAPRQVERITINNQEDLARAIRSLTVVKVDAEHTLSAAASRKVNLT